MAEELPISVEPTPVAEKTEVKSPVEAEKGAEVKAKSGRGAMSPFGKGMDVLNVVGMVLMFPQGYEMFKGMLKDSGSSSAHPPPGVGASPAEVSQYASRPPGTYASYSVPPATMGVTSPGFAPSTMASGTGMPSAIATPNYEMPIPSAPNPISGV